MNVPYWLSFFFKYILVLDFEFFQGPGQNPKPICITIKDLRNEKSNSILMNYLNEDFTQNLYSKQLEINKKLKMYIKFAERESQKEIFETEKISKAVSDNIDPYKKILP